MSRMKTSLCPRSPGRALLMRCVILLVLPCTGLTGCAAAAMGVASVATTAGSLAVSAVSTATSAAYSVGKAAF